MPGDDPIDIASGPTVADPTTCADALAIAALPFIDGLQLHGAETPEFCAALAAAGVRFAKAVPVGASGPLSDVTAFATRTLVLDAQNESGFGGTGSTFPWPIARALVERQGALRFVLAGGLTPENVTEAIALVRPYGVDVTSGVELAPGRKDHGKLRAFLAAARSA